MEVIAHQNGRKNVEKKNEELVFLVHVKVIKEGKRSQRGQGSILDLNLPHDILAQVKFILLYSWRFSHYSVPFHWLVHGHMTSNNETVSRQMP